jgi:hypothetical protein
MAAVRIDAALRQWRQGDVALDAQWFVHVADPRQPLTRMASAEDGDGPQALTYPVEGLVLVTQTCDVVRSCVERPYAEFSPIVEVPGEVLHDIERARRPAYAYVPALADRRLAADIDRVMTVEKSIVSTWTRTSGWSTDAESREFARALARKRVRFAFPDDFTDFAKKLYRRVTDKHDRNTEEGRGLRALHEIRIQAEPSWHAHAVELTFWFVRKNDGPSFEGKSWDTLLDAWLKLMPVDGRYKAVRGSVVLLEDLTAADYVGSDRLDLDHLSLRE